jgi:PAS domain S-box-containing protein
MDPVLLALLLERLTWGAGVVAVGYGFLQRNSWTWPLLKRSLAWAKTRLPGRETQRKLDLVLSQLHPNGGSSLFDLTKRNEEVLIRIRRHLAVVEAQSHAMRDGAGILAYTTNAEGVHVQSSRPLLQLVGMTAEEAAGLGWKNGIAPEDLGHYIEDWGSAVQDQRDFVGELRLRNVRSGQLMPVRVTADVVRVDGVVVGWMGLIERQGP